MKPRPPPESPETKYFSDVLLTLSKSAYQAEQSARWSEAYDLHKKATEDYAAFLKKPVKQVPWQYGKSYLQYSQYRKRLHLERMAYIQPWAKGGHPVPERVIMHPSNTLTVRGFSESGDMVELLRSVTKNEALVLTHQQVTDPNATGLSNYSDTLPRNLPPNQYEIDYHTEHRAYLEMELCVATVTDKETSQTLLILETWVAPRGSRPQVREAFVYRAADYPIPVFHHVYNHDHCTRSVSSGPWLWMSSVFPTLIYGLPEPDWRPEADSDTIAAFRRASSIITEVPDREGYPGPVRFSFGGRQFVRKPPAGDEKYASSWSDQVLREFTTTEPVAGSKTGKRKDDASDVKLAWLESRGKWAAARGRFTVKVAAGIDPLFKEYVLAATLMKLVSTARGTEVGGSRLEGDPKIMQEILAKGGASLAISMVLGILFAS
ncbi:uncharacterized protein B0I36DRAFT_354381 [Microdochium trichocladiopsis]|uniref:Uncharacterized protein n=1 Tax=Microdochium trichocladiopsis TaxID=1682393 RepID=A0A9P9BJE4_9PEZI|nr:uncharacterized protein B0I36DRAFT_354381 [Microdochium trichocladiopsis]KAH7018063.1 hypothetical protein B0I36DRAFT_354381 [Microdochium trichocladiopsis]